MAAWDADRYIIRNDEPDRTEKQNDNTEEKCNESSINDRVRSEFMRQIGEKKKELDSLNQQRNKLQKEIELLEEMLEKI